ncbi:MAG: sulfatase-like hydrolase/transferase, partial [Planctomycetota bacterium]
TNLLKVLLVGGVIVICVVVGLKYGLGGGDEEAYEGPLNVLLITLDTTRADHLGCYDYSSALTPGTDTLAKRGVVFEQAFSSIPLTLPSHTTMMTGLHPPEHGLRHNGDCILDLDRQTLAEILKERGYETGAFIASFTLDSRNGLDRGFDAYDDDMSRAYSSEDVQGPVLCIYRAGDLVADSALTWLGKRKKDRPFFCWVHLFDAHHPAHDHEALADTRFANHAPSYDSEIAFADMQVVRLTDFLKESGLSASTLIVVAGDHGEALGEHDEPSHGHKLYEGTLHVPLIFSLPGRIPKGERVEETVALVDLFATIQDLLGFEGFEERSGRSLAPALLGQPIESRPAFSETQAPWLDYRWAPLTSLTTAEWKFIHTARDRLFNRKEDPRELNNLASARPEKLNELRQLLKDLESRFTKHEAQVVEATEAEIAQLAALGYLSGGGNQEFDAQEFDISDLKDVDDMTVVIDKMNEIESLHGKWEEQIPVLRETIKLSPGSPLLHKLLADALFFTGRMKEALPVLLEYLTLNPSDRESQKRAGAIFALDGDFQKSLEHFFAAIELNPSDSGVHLAVAKILLRYRDPRGATRHTDESLHEAVPLEAWKHYDIGIVLGRQGRFEESLQHFAEALKIVPDDATTHFGLATVLEQKGDFAGASEEFAKALRLDDSDAQARLCLGSLLAAQGRLDEGIEHLAKYIETVPGNVHAHVNLARALSERGRLVEAAEEFRRAVALQSDNANARRNLAEVYLKQGKSEDALNEYTEIVRREPNDAAAQRDRGVLLGKLGRLEEAIESFSESLRAQPNNGEVLFLRAGLLESQGRLKEAVADYRASLRLNPGQPDVANNLAWILATNPHDEIRNGTEAVVLATLACTVNQYKDPGTLDSLAAAYAEAGRFEQAVVTARQALDLVQESLGQEDLAEAGEARLQSFSDELEARIKLYEAGMPYRAESQ